MKGLAGNSLNKGVVSKMRLGMTWPEPSVGPVGEVAGERILRQKETRSRRPLDVFYSRRCIQQDVKFAEVGEGFMVK